MLPTLAPPDAPLSCFDAACRALNVAAFAGVRLTQGQALAARHCDFFRRCGTSALVQPVASPTNIAVDAGAATIQINPNHTDIDNSVTSSIRDPAGTVPPQLAADTWNISP